MGTIEVFDHTADVGLRISGDDPADLFRTAAEGFVRLRRRQSGGGPG